jgi:hypothetical protein
MTVHVEGGSGRANNTFADCNFHDFKAYGCYSNAADSLNFIGTSITKFSGDGAGSLHGIRIDGTQGVGQPIHGKHFISENTVLAGNGAVFTATEIHGNTSDAVMAYNHDDRPIAATPVNHQTEEQVSNVLFEGNFVQDPDEDSLINIVANHVVARNNVIVNANIAITVVGWELEAQNWVDQIVVQNNTAFYCPQNAATYMFPGNFAQHATTTGSLTLQNNLYYVCTNNTGSEMLLGVVTGTETIDHNLLYSSIVAATNPGVGSNGKASDPMFSMVPADSVAPVSSPAVFALEPGSPAIGAGTLTTAYQDLNGIPRPQGGWDIGALQSIP